MYTFAPIENINTVDTHTGFYIMLAIVAVLFIAAIFDDDTDVQDVKVYLFISACVISISAGVSWNTGEIKEFKNEKVVANLVGFVAEGHGENRLVGKITHRVEVNKTYVQYEVNEKVILFEAHQGLPYHKKVILYKN